MSSFLCTHHGQPAVQLSAPDGAQITVLLQGAHLVSWITAEGKEQIYVSPQSVWAPGQAVRGGVPVIFPQFECRGPLPRHGLARTAAWTCVQAEQGRDDALAVLRWTDDAATASVWPAAFECEMSFRIEGQRLDMELACINRGDQAWSFTAALHTYVQMPSLMHCEIAGLEGRPYQDMLAQGQWHQHPLKPLHPEPPIDRIYQEVPRAITVKSAGRHLRIEHHGFEDVVIWNPGAQGAQNMPDMDPEGWRKMLCIEAARILRPVSLEPQEEWVGTQTLISHGA